MVLIRQEETMRNSLRLRPLYFQSLKLRDWQFLLFSQCFPLPFIVFGSLTQDCTYKMRVSKSTLHLKPPGEISDKGQRRCDSRPLPESTASAYWENWQCSAWKNVLNVNRLFVQHITNEETNLPKTWPFLDPFDFVMHSGNCCFNSLWHYNFAKTLQKPRK